MIIEELRKQITDLEMNIDSIQDDCSHPIDALELEHKGNTGNYDPHQDKYWTEFTCKLCLKQWSEDGTHRKEIKDETD